MKAAAAIRRGSLDAVAEVVGIVALAAFTLLAFVAFGKPLLHALRTGPLPFVRPGPFRPPPWGDDGETVGVREPRRPSPSGAEAAAVLPEPSEPK